MLGFVVGAFDPRHTLLSSYLEAAYLLVICERTTFTREHHVVACTLRTATERQDYSAAVVILLGFIEHNCRHCGPSDRRREPATSRVGQRYGLPSRSKRPVGERGCVDATPRAARTVSSASILSDTSSARATRRMARVKAPAA